MWIWEWHKRRKIRKFVRYIERFFNKYSNRYDEITLKAVDQQIGEVQQLLESGDIQSLEKAAGNLFNTFGEKKREIKSSTREFIEAIVIAIILALFIREFVIQAFKIPSRSMEDTLLVGDHILVWKCYYGIRIPFTDTRLLSFGKPDHGDIVVFTPPHDPEKDFIKRVIAVEGDTFEMVNDQVFLNGERINEPYVKRAFRSYRYSNYHKITVQKDMLFVMGDNRADSYDSRGWGFLKENKVKGKAFVIYLPWITSAEVREHHLNPYNIFGRIRWGRMFHLIR